MSKPKLTNDDFRRAAKKLRCEVAAIRTVAEVESKGEGFYDDGFPVILFERHKFREFTDGKYSRSHPSISGPAGGYGKAGQNQRNKFNLAFGLDPIAAMKSCSWGKFQLMGFNHELCGFDTVGQFVDGMKESEGRQLDGFVSFVINTGLSDELRRHDWTSFAHGYNGPGYKKNRYDTKMAAAYKRFASENHANSAAAPAVDLPSVKLDEQSSASAANQTAADNLVDAGTQSTNLKAEITPDGGVKVESTESVPGPKERIAVVKTKPKKWYEGVGAKITGIVTGNSLFQWIWAQVEKLQDVQVHWGIWVAISAIIGGGSLIWIVWAILDNRQENNRQKELDELLVKENSTPNNLVQLIPHDESVLYRQRGFKIITRGE